MSTPISQLIGVDRPNTVATLSTREPELRPATAPRGPDQVDAELPADQTDMPPTKRNLSESLPHDTALLKVVLTSFDGELCFKLEGYFRGRVWVSLDDDLRGQRRPARVLAELLSGGEIDDETAVGYYQEMISWSQTKRKLIRWIRALRREFGTGLRMVVWDDTDFSIPWELFRFDSTDKLAWLGVAVPIVRWTTVHDVDRSEQFSAERYAGAGQEILYYEGPGLDNPNLSIKDDRQGGYRCATSMKALLTELEQGAATYGFVYVRDHGVHGDRITAARLAGVTLAEMNTVVMRSLQEARAMVMLNACNSARVVIDSALADASNRSFAEIFLRYRAAAVVATMAEVPIWWSAMLARNLVAQARAGDVPVVEFLREYRQTEAEDLPGNTLNLDADACEVIRAFLYASMVAYYGHPDTVFRLAPR